MDGMTQFNPPVQQDDKGSDVITETDYSQFKTLGGRIMGRRFKQEWKQEGALYLDSKRHSDYQDRVEIVSVGPDVEHVKNGDMVLIGPYSDVEINQYVFFSEADIRVRFVNDPKRQPKFEPIGDLVLVLREKPEEKEGEIIITDYRSERGGIGKVVGIGKEVEGLEVDDHVVFSKTDGSEIQVEGQEYTLLHEIEIGGILE